MEKSAKIYVAGHRGMVGSAIVRELKNLGYQNILVRTSSELDLRNQAAVEAFYAEEKPDYVFVSAAKVGGILANNTYRADFLYDNLSIQNNLIHFAHVYGVKKLLFLGSSCIYPKMAPQPLKEDYLLSGFLEPTNEPYAIAKITGIKMCEAYHMQYGLDYAVVIPNNIYGPGDNYHPENSHVMASLIKKFHEAIQNGTDVEIWGSGKQMREFIYVDDVAKACVSLMDSSYIGSYNCSSEYEITIKDLAELIAKILEFKGNIVYNTDKPEGHPRKGFSCDKLKETGWEALTSLEEGIRSAYEWYKQTLIK
jgi:GDP-L-fucose synthase